MLQQTLVMIISQIIALGVVYWFIQRQDRIVSQLRERLDGVNADRIKAIEDSIQKLTDATDRSFHKAADARKEIYMDIRKVRDEYVTYRTSCEQQERIQIEFKKVDRQLGMNSAALSEVAGKVEGINARLDLVLRNMQVILPQPKG
jgi:methyl-accepting chemotaxis protein